MAISEAPMATVGVREKMDECLQKRRGKVTPTQCWTGSSLPPYQAKGQSPQGVDSIVFDKFVKNPDGRPLVEHHLTIGWRTLAGEVSA